MSKKILLLASALLAVAVLVGVLTHEPTPLSARGEQFTREMLPLKVVYHNKRTDIDTCSETADTLRIGLRGKGTLAPVGVVLAFTARDADVSATPDSMDVTFRAGIRGIYATVGSKTLTVSGTLPATANRTLVFNTTGAATALNTQAAVFPYCDGLELWIENGSGGTTSALNDSIGYTVQAWGIYESGRIFVDLPFKYKNKNSFADSALGTTLDTVRIGVTPLGGLAPLGVGVVFRATDADVTDAADSLLVQSFGALNLTGVRYVYNLGTGTAFSEAAPIGASGTATGIRSYIFNTTGAATARNTQATLSPYFNQLELRVRADDSGDTTRYTVRALGVYVKN